MPYQLDRIECWICGQPYQPKRPENKVHRACEDARRRQAAAEDAHAKAEKSLRKRWPNLTIVEIPAPSIEKVEYFDDPKPPRPTRIEITDEEIAELDSALDAAFKRAVNADVPPLTRPWQKPADAPLKILVIPDTQVKPGVPTEHLTWAGQYAAQKRPDVIVHLGDHWDMPSLSSYDVGKKSYEGRRYVDDIDAGNKALNRFDFEIAKVADYFPRKVFLIGNHEQRIERAIESDRKLEGLIGYHHFNLAENGWEVHDFLEIVEIAGVEFSHYFVSGAMGRPVSSAATLLRERQGSAIMGHNQIFQIATHPKTHAMGIFAGAFYQHNEKYLSPQDQDHRRQVLVLHEAHDGVFDLMMVSLGFLQRRFA